MLQQKLADEKKVPVATKVDGKTEHRPRPAIEKDVLAAWPDECAGAYICCLSNPQNLDITAVLNHPDLHTQY